MASQYSQDKTGFPREACLALCCLAPARLQPHRALLCLRLSACSLHRSGLESQDPLPCHWDLCPYSVYQNIPCLLLNLLNLCSAFRSHHRHQISKEDFPGLPD